MIAKADDRRPDQGALAADSSCVFGPVGALVNKPCPASGAGQSSGAAIKPRISPAILRLAAFIARGRVPPSMAADLSDEGRAGAALLVNRIAEIDKAIRELVDVIPGNCPAAIYALVGEVFAGGVALALGVGERR